jgi:uncharacterized protein involved in tolerance to divalent cations
MDLHELSKLAPIRGAVQARVVLGWNAALMTDAIVVLTTVATEDEAMLLVRALLDTHKVPELLALPVSAGMEQYLGWIGRET